MSNQIKTFLENANAEITVLSKSSCGSCNSLKELLHEHHIPFNEISLDEKEVADQYKEEGVSTVPHVFVTSKTENIKNVIGGYPETKKWIEELVNMHEAETQND